MVTALRDKLAPKARTAILSNSALVSDREVREALTRLELRIMKLDCGTEEMFERYNKPCAGVDLEKITLGLEQLSGIFIQTLVTSGPSGNLEPENISAWIRRVKWIKPSFIQLYTLDRGCPADGLKPVFREDLHRIKENVEKSGLAAGVF